MTVDCIWSIVFLSEIGWSVYGNTFIYGDEIINCDDTFESVFVKSDLDITTERTTALVLIIYGYFLLFAMLMGMCVGCAAYFAYKDYTAADRAIRSGSVTSENSERGLLSRATTRLMTDG